MKVNKKMILKKLFNME